MKKIRIGINGFGRIGRSLFRLLVNHPHIEIVAINDIANSKILSHLLKYDSIHGVIQHAILYDKNHIIVNNKKIRLLNKKRISEITWKEFALDIVIESTGKFKTFPELEHHVKNGAKKVILTAPLQTMLLKWLF